MFFRLFMQTVKSIFHGKLGTSPPKFFHYPLWPRTFPLYSTYPVKWGEIKYEVAVIKSINLQYNTLVHWANGTNVSSTKHLMLQVFFFSHKILQSSLQKSFQFIVFIFSIKLKKNEMSFECPKSVRNYEKNTWNIRRLVDESFVLSVQWTSELYYRLSDL